MKAYKQPLPEVDEPLARILLWVLLGVTVINTAMIFYVFFVVERAVEVLHQLSQLGQ